VGRQQRSVRCIGCASSQRNRVKYARRRTRKNSGFFEAVDHITVFEAAGWVCALCGVPTPSSLVGSSEGRAPTLDHIMPLSLGGEHSYRNTQCLCRRCNTAKGARHPKEFGMVGF
jgi:5-methylcytosine-specific restriction endonuclease McrA